jgi:hypothetical protein
MSSVERCAEPAPPATADGRRCFALTRLADSHLG